MSMKHRNYLVSAFVIGSLISGCQKKDDESEDSSTENGGTVASGGGGGGGSTTAVSSATSIDELKLSSAFKVSLPAALSGSGGAGLNLTDSKKSQEACMMGQAIKEVTQRINSVGNFMCHIEIEKDRIKFGIKYAIVSNGMEFGRIFVDNSEAASGKLTLGFCGKGGGDDGESNREMIVIDGLTAFGPKGSIINSGEYKQDGISSSYSTDITYDKSIEGALDLIGNQLHTAGDNSFRRAIKLALKDNGLNVASLATRGTWQGNEFLERGTAKMNTATGSALFQSSGEHEGQTFSFARRAFFNVEGQVVPKDDVSADVKVEVSELPAFLSDDFAPAKASEWVESGCATVDENVELNPESTEHQACDGDHDDSHTECWSQDSFEAGSENVEVE